MHRVCAQCVRAGGSQLQRVRPGTPHRIIYKLRELRGIEEMGGTMRLGAWTCMLQPGSLAPEAYGTTEITNAIAIAMSSTANMKRC